jgi:hypothetical protein
VIPESPEFNPSFTPEEFEAFVAQHLRYLAGLSKVRCQIVRRELVRGADGEFEIDVTLRFSTLGLSFLVLVECKHHRYPIKRDVAQVLRDKVSSVGAHKGVIYSTAPFQTGAIEYAKHHGLALIYCKPQTEPHAVVGGWEEPTFGGEESGWFGLTQPIEWDFYWQGERISAEHWHVAAILTGVSPF